MIILFDVILMSLRSESKKRQNSSDQAATNVNSKVDTRTLLASVQLSKLESLSVLLLNVLCNVNS